MYEPSSVAMGRAHVAADDERERAARVEQLGLIQAGSAELTQVTRDAMQAMGTQVAAVTVLLRENQFLIARSGTAAPILDRASSFCTHVTAAGTALTVGDATRHPNFAFNPNVGFDAQSVRAYSGVPIATADGLVVAVLCVVDPQPKEFTTDQCVALQELGGVAASILLPGSIALAGCVPVAPPVDDLSRWIEAHVPHEDELAIASLRRSRGRLSARLRPGRRTAAA